MPLERKKLVLIILIPLLSAKKEYFEMSFDGLPVSIIMLIIEIKLEQFYPNISLNILLTIC